MLHDGYRSFMNCTYDDAVTYARAYIAALKCVIDAEMCVREQAVLHRARAHDRRLRLAQHVGSMWDTTVQLVTVVMLLGLFVYLVRSTVHVVLQRSELHQLLIRLLHHNADDPHALLGSEQQGYWNRSSAGTRQCQMAIFRWATVKLLLAASMLCAFLCASDLLYVITRFVFSTWWSGLGASVARPPRWGWPLGEFNPLLWRSRDGQVDHRSTSGGGGAALHSSSLLAVWRSILSIFVWYYWGLPMLQASFHLIESMACNMKDMLESITKDSRGERLIEQVQEEERVACERMRHAEVMERLNANTTPHMALSQEAAIEGTDSPTTQSAHVDTTPTVAEGQAM